MRRRSRGHCSGRRELPRLGPRHARRRSEALHRRHLPERGLLRGEGARQRRPERRHVPPGLLRRSAHRARWRRLPPDTRRLRLEVRLLGTRQRRRLDHRAHHHELRVLHRRDRGHRHRAERLERQPLVPVRLVLHLRRPRPPRLPRAVLRRAGLQRRRRREGRHPRGGPPPRARPRPPVPSALQRLSSRRDDGARRGNGGDEQAGALRGRRRGRLHDLPGGRTDGEVRRRSGR